MKLAGATQRTLRWPIDPRGAARGVTEREAVIIDVAGGRGEAAPLAGMSIDTLADARAAADALAAAMPVELSSAEDACALADRLTAAPAARFAIETALLSALAGTAGIASLFGTPHEVELAVVVDDPLEAALAVQRGARCLKIKASAPDRVEAIARSVPGVPLRIDANRSWPRDAVEPWLDRLAGLSIAYVEEPCRDAHELLDQDLPVKLALDESLIDLDADQLAGALRSRSLAALVLKPTLLGGFARCLQLAALAHDHGKSAITSHTLEGPIGYGACMELARIIGDKAPAGLGPYQ